MKVNVKILIPNCQSDENQELIGALPVVLKNKIIIERAIAILSQKELGKIIQISHQMAEIGYQPSKSEQK